MKFDFDDVLIQPAAISSIESRKIIDIYDDNGNLPLFTAPMDTVINYENMKYFRQNKFCKLDYSKMAWITISRRAKQYCKKLSKTVYGNGDTS